MSWVHKIIRYLSTFSPQCVKRPCSKSRFNTLLIYSVTTVSLGLFFVFTPSKKKKKCLSKRNVTKFLTGWVANLSGNYFCQFSWYYFFSIPCCVYFMFVVPIVLLIVALFFFFFVLQEFPGLRCSFHLSFHQFILLFHFFRISVSWYKQF